MYNGHTGEVGVLSTVERLSLSEVTKYVMDTLGARSLVHSREVVIDKPVNWSGGGCLLTVSYQSFFQSGPQQLSV